MPASGEMDASMGNMGGMPTSAAPAAPQDAAAPAAAAVPGAGAEYAMPASGEMDTSMGNMGGMPSTAPAAPQEAAPAAAAAASAAPEAAEGAENAENTDGAQGMEDMEGMPNMDAASAAPAAKAAKGAKGAKTAKGTKGAENKDAQPAADGEWRVLVDQITIDGGHVEWRDAQPAATVHVNGLAVAARAFAWPLTEPMEFEGSLAVSAPGVSAKAVKAAAQEDATEQPDAAASTTTKTTAKKAASSKKKTTRAKKSSRKKKTSAAAPALGLFETVASALVPAAQAQPAIQITAQTAAKTDKKTARKTKRKATGKTARKSATKTAAAAAPAAALAAASAASALDAASTPASAASIADTTAQAASSPASSAGGAIDTPMDTASAASVASAPEAPASAASSAAEVMVAAPIAQELQDSADAASAAGSAAATLAAPGAAWKRASGAQTLRFKGSATMQSAQVQAEASGIALALARPYIAPFLNGQLDGRASAQVDVQWSAPDALLVKAPSLALDALTLTGAGIAAPAAGGQSAPARTAPGATATTSGSARDPASPLDRARSGPLVAVERIAVEGAALDLAAHSVSAERLSVRAPRVTVLRNADGSLMAQSWLRPQPASSEKSAAAGAPWSAQLGEAVVQGGTIAWRDAVPARPVRADLGNVNLKASGIHWDGAKLAGALPVELSAQVTAAGRRSDPGRLSWNGQVRLDPLAVRGSVNAERLPAHAFMPYAGSSLNIDVLRADASFKGNVQMAQQPAGISLAVQGDARLQELRMHSLPDSEKRSKARAARTASQAPLAPDAAAERRASGLGEELLSLKNLRVQGVNVQMQPRRPLRISTGQTTLSDFYARLVILPDGTFSLRDIVGEDGAAAPAAQQKAATPAAPDPNAPVIRIGPVRVSGGRVAFTDRFIRPNYSADLSELTGSLGAFSTVPPGGQVQMAELKLTGRAQGTAALDISGRVNPLAQPLALDIKGSATDLELPPLSPYSVKYAGHGIERGKLSVSVNYVVQPDGSLTASNNIVLNQLEFGEPVEGAPNSLPVKLATALLADSNGVINLDIPISGSLNDPEFSIGPIVFKAIGGIIAKAVTAPFRAIAGIFGGSGSGGDPSQVIFKAGSSTLDDAARKQLDAVAKALQERTALKLTITGAAELATERVGWQRQRLRDMLAAELRGDAPAERENAAEGDEAEGKGEAASAPAAPQRTGNPAETEAALAKLSAEDYVRLVRRLYRRADLPGKPRNALGMARTLPVEEMERLLMEQIEVDDDAMRTLAQARAVAVKDYLAAKGLASSRIFLGSTRTSAPKGKKTAAPAATQGGESDEAGSSAATAPASAASAPHIPAGSIAGAELALGAK